jgi:hypothetical protein
MIEDQYMLAMIKSSNLSTFDHAFNQAVILAKTGKHRPSQKGDASSQS